MKQISYLLLFFLLVTSSFEQTLKLEGHEFEAVGSFVSQEKLDNKKVIKVIKDSSIQKSDEPTYARLKNIDFTNGVIEVKVLSRLLKTEPEYARGFIGIAFHINESNTKFESIYLRPTNARANDQVRRNHSIQYFAFPDYTFDRLRKESPERYESYADMELNQWITMRIEVKDAQAKLIIDKNQQPSLIVNDLKHGANASGSIALWVETGTEGYFKDLKITKQ